MRSFFILASALLYGCSESDFSEAEFPMIANASEASSVIVEANIGCTWKEHTFDVHPPLTGKLKLNFFDCPVDKRYRPKYGYKKILFLDENNELRIKKRPSDPKHPSTSNSSGPYLQLHALTNVDEQAFMQKFLNKTIHSDCVIRKNTSGRWQTGFEREVLEEKGWQFFEYENECPTELPPYKPRTMHCTSEEDFPMAVGGGNLCHFGDAFFSGTVYRISGPIIFEYQKRLIEPHLADQAIIDKYSVKYIP